MRVFLILFILLCFSACGRTDEPLQVEFYYENVCASCEGDADFYALYNRCISPEEKEGLDVEIVTYNVFLHKQGCAIGSIDNGYFIPTNEDERRAGIIKKQRTGIAINNAVNGYTLAELDWIDQLFKED